MAVEPTRLHVRCTRPLHPPTECCHSLLTQLLPPPCCLFLLFANVLLTIPPPGPWSLHGPPHPTARRHMQQMATSVLPLWGRCTATCCLLDPSRC